MCSDEDGEETGSVKGNISERGEMPTSLVSGSAGIVAAGKGFFDVPTSAPAIEYKKGYVMRKSCVEPNGKKSKSQKRTRTLYFIIKSFISLSSMLLIRCVNVYTD